MIIMWYDNNVFFFFSIFKLMWNQPQDQNVNVHWHKKILLRKYNTKKKYEKKKKDFPMSF